MAQVAPGAREAEGWGVLTWILVPLASRGASMASSDRAYASRRLEGPLDPVRELGEPVLLRFFFSEKL